MRNKLTGMAVVAVSILAASGFAQTAAELLQKGIYTQETAGNLDAAIAIYRQVVTTSPDRSVAAQAQLCLFQALLRKGDLNVAAQEFQKLVTNYSDFRELIVEGANRSHRLQAPPKQLGTFQAGRYHHNATGIEFNLPAGWSIEGESPSSDDGEMVTFTDDVSKVPFAAVWVKVDPTPAEKMADRLRGAIPQKISQRTGFSHYTIRPESVQSKIIGGKQALCAVADFEEDGVKMAESLNWIYADRSRALFFARLPAVDLASFQARFDQVILSAMVP